MSHDCAVVFNESISDQLTCLIELMIDIVTFDILRFNQQVSIVERIITDLYSSDLFCYNRRLNLMNCQYRRINIFRGKQNFYGLH